MRTILSTESPVEKEPNVHGSPSSFENQQIRSESQVSGRTSKIPEDDTLILNAAIKSSIHRVKPIPQVLNNFEMPKRLTD